MYSHICVYIYCGSQLLLFDSQSKYRGIHSDINATEKMQGWHAGSSGKIRWPMSAPARSRPGCSHEDSKEPLFQGAWSPEPGHEWVQVMQTSSITVRALALDMCSGAQPGCKVAPRLFTIRAANPDATTSKLLPPESTRASIVVHRGHTRQWVLVDLRQFGSVGHRNRHAGGFKHDALGACFSCADLKSCGAGIEFHLFSARWSFCALGLPECLPLLAYLASKWPPCPKVRHQWTGFLRKLFPVWLWTLCVLARGELRIPRKWPFWNN